MDGRDLKTRHPLHSDLGGEDSKGHTVEIVWGAGAGAGTCCALAAPAQCRLGLCSPVLPGVSARRQPTLGARSSPRRARQRTTAVVDLISPAQPLKSDELIKSPLGNQACKKPAGARSWHTCCCCAS